jgi:hypothetical protein
VNPTNDPHDGTTRSSDYKGFPSTTMDKNGCIEGQWMQYHNFSKQQQCVPQEFKPTEFNGEKHREEKSYNFSGENSILVELDITSISMMQKTTR